MTLKFHNTQSGRKEAFEPLDPANVRMYVCGPTVYDLAHIGNARPVIVFDVLYRLLRQFYGDAHVTYVRNITDVDDKIIEAARRNDEPIDKLTARTIAAFHGDMAAVGALDPDVEPRATGHIPDMLSMVECLVSRGFAYAAEGHVLFHVPAMTDYGGLSHRSPDDMIAGARVEVAPYKKHAADFVLWKPSAPDDPGWDSPWGRGRPGWHLECSVMSGRHLGVSFDIHGGGQDLIFPHHENERAQSTCAKDGATFARFWIHNGFVTVEGEKMSKSLGNVLTVRDVLSRVNGRGEAVRLLMLGTHYRKPLDWTETGVREAKATMDRFYTALQEADGIEADAPPPREILAALADDLNTPLAIAVLRDYAKSLNKAGDGAAKARFKGLLMAGAGVLGLLRQRPCAWFKDSVGPDESGVPTTDDGRGISDQMIDDLIARRSAARVARDFSAADRIRDDLAGQGVILEDTPGGTRWKRAG